MLSAIVNYSSTGATHLGLWAHLQQPLATTAGIYNSDPTATVPTLMTVRALEGRRTFNKDTKRNHRRVQQRPSS